MHPAIKHLTYFFKVRLQRSQFKLGCQAQFPLGNPLYTCSRCVSWLGEHTVSGVVAPVCSLGHWNHGFNVSSGHITWATGAPKLLSLQEVNLFWNGWMCKGHVKIIHLVRVTGRRSGKGLKFKCKPISLENVENVKTMFRSLRGFGCQWAQFGLSPPTPEGPWTRLECERDQSDVLHT